MNVILQRSDKNMMDMVCFLCLITYQPFMGYPMPKFSLNKKNSDTIQPIDGEIRRGLSIFTHPSARVGYDTRSIFKRILTGLNSEFSFS